MLYLSLTRETYERAGLTAQAKKPASKSANQKYRLAYDLRSASSTRGQPMFDRLIWALENTITEDVAVAFTVTKSDNCTPLSLDTPSLDTDTDTDTTTSEEESKAPSIMSLFDTYTLTTTHLSITTTIYKDISPLIPDFAVPHDPQTLAAVAVFNDRPAEQATFEREITQEWALDLQEWVTLVALGSDRVAAGDDVDPVYCAYRPAFVKSDELSDDGLHDKLSDEQKKEQKKEQKEAEKKNKQKKEKSITVVTWSGGLIPAGVVWNLWKALEKVNTWAAINVHGVEDTPVSWGSREHTYTLGGENHYTAMKLSPGAYDYLLLEVTDAGDN